jgi:E3 ubiquitin-protein ligase listerin
LVDRLLPGPSQWEKALQPFVEIAPKFSLAITDPLAGCVHLVEQTEITNPSLTNQSRDSNGYSTAIRIASYTTKLLKANNVFDFLDQDKQTAVLGGIVLTMQLANDNLGLAGANHLWTQYSSDVEEDMLEFISDAHEVVVKLLRDGVNAITLQPNALDSIWMSSALKKTSARAFYIARASSFVFSELVELHDFQLNNVSVWIATLTEYRKNKGRRDTIIFV